MRHALALACWICVLAGTAAAQDAPAAPPAILQPKDGEVVTGPVTVVIAPGAAVPDAMPGMPAHGTHLHLIIDAPLPAAGTTIPMDGQHLHLMHGETRKTLALAPGKHTLQLIQGSMSHTVAADAPHSDPVTFEVK